MRRILHEAILPILVITLATACHERTSTPMATTALDMRTNVNGSEWSAWSAPVKLGPPINVPLVTDGNATLSPDGLSLYYDSDRTDLPDAQGARDIWASRRACTNPLDAACAWQTPINLGSVINSPYVDGFPSLSVDGHLLFFVSHRTRPDCEAEENEVDPTRPCDTDIFVSWRADPNDDRGWGPPAPLPPGVNSNDEEGGPWLAAVGEPGRGNLYFDRAPSGTPAFDLYVAPVRVTSRGSSWGPAVDLLGPIVALNELNLPEGLDGAVTTSMDGQELFFMSSVERTGRGAVDIWTSTRRNSGEPWNPPTNVGELNSVRADQSPRLSRDGQTMLLTSNRGDLANAACLAAGLPASCGWDIYMTTRNRP